MAEIKLKNRMTRHESRRPSPKATGPSVPVENLRTQSSVTDRLSDASDPGENGTDATMFVFTDTHIKNILIKCVSVLSSTATGWMPVQWQVPEWDGGHRTSRSLIRDDYVPSPKCDTYPALLHPRSEAFSRGAGGDSGWWGSAPRTFLGF